MLDRLVGAVGKTAQFAEQFQHLLLPQGEMLARPLALLFEVFEALFSGHGGTKTKSEHRVKLKPAAIRVWALSFLSSDHNTYAYSSRFACRRWSSNCLN
jgi:hypothetical protein